MDVEVKPLLTALDRAVRLGDPVRLAPLVEGLEVVSVGIDCRVASYLREAKGDPLGPDHSRPVYVQGAPMFKALQIRATDKPVKLRADATHLHVRHGAYKMKLPLVQDTFEMAAPTNRAWLPGGGFEDRLDQVAPIVDKKERHGILAHWGEGRISLVGRAGGRQVHIASWECDVGSGVGRVCFSRAAADHVRRLGKIQTWLESDGSLFFRSGDAAIRVSPIRDGYPQDYYQALCANPYSLVCEFGRDELIFAVKAASAVLSKNDIDVTVVAEQVVEDGTIVFKVRARNSVTQATAEESVVAATMTPSKWRGRLNSKDLQVSLARFGSKTVMVSFGEKLVRFNDDALQVFLLLLSGG